MEQINLPIVSEEKKDKSTSVFRISPLFPGYGHTVGNALRRVLLSSLPGAAVTAVSIEGASHEFTSLSGVKEDAVEIILNLKNLHVTMHETGAPITLSLSAKGPGVVKAKDFKANSNITISNPDLHIATLSAKSSLNLDVTIEYGRGYDPVEKREAKSLPLGTIAIDSLFTPVREVSIEVENTRVGKMTNYDELLLTVTTDGTIAVSDALKQSAEILVDQFNLLAHFGEMAEVKVEAADQDGATSEPEELIAAGLPAKVARILADNGVSSVEQLKSTDAATFKTFTGLGPKALTEIAKIQG